MPSSACNNKKALPDRRQPEIAAEPEAVVVVSALGREEVIRLRRSDRVSGAQHFTLDAEDMRIAPARYEPAEKSLAAKLDRLGAEELVDHERRQLMRGVLAPAELVCREIAAGGQLGEAAALALLFGGDFEAKLERRERRFADVIHLIAVEQRGLEKADLRGAGIAAVVAAGCGAISRVERGEDPAGAPIGGVGSDVVHLTAHQAIEPAHGVQNRGADLAPHALRSRGAVVERER